MGKLNTFAIMFSNPQGVFYAGQNVEGQCTVELNEEMSMRGIRLKFTGGSYVHWTERNKIGHGNTRVGPHDGEHAGNSGRATFHYRASETYLTQDVLLYGIWPSQGRDKTTLAKGCHTFPFCFVLPPHVPSSFEGFHGYVRYSVTGTIDKPWEFDHTCLRPFTVICLLDLNMDPNVQIPVQGKNEKKLCCLCCASGPITAEFRLERRGYVPGEPISLFADIQNDSNRRVDKSYIDLKMVTMYHATRKSQQGRMYQLTMPKSRTVIKEVARITQGPIEAGQPCSWEGQQLVIPPLPPSFLAGCNIIDIRYILQLNVDPSGMSFDLEVPLEIIIGTIPLREVVSRYAPLPAAVRPSHVAGTVYPSPQGASAQYPSAIQIQPCAIPSLPPPCYRENVLGNMDTNEDDDTEHAGGALDFAPAYTYYDWGQQPTTMDGKH
ncbi:hypothetical protein V1264_001566 [Littorina saxatilis]|uniref:Arrestin C-terminal-like domain-containing protein n=2 Tax=Littorina saxatilis TaxID=31220 RepID=A0AAN9C7E3_9CAEN